MWNLCPLAALWLFAAARMFSPELIIGTLALIGLILLGIIAIVWVERWWKRSVQDRPGDELASFRALLEQGALSAEEFERIRAKMGQKSAGSDPNSPPTKVQETKPSPAPQEGIKPVPPFSLEGPASSASSEGPAVPP